MRKLLMLLMAMCILPTVVFAMEEDGNGTPAGHRKKRTKWVPVAQFDGGASTDGNNLPAQAVNLETSGRAEGGLEALFSREERKKQQKAAYQTPAQEGYDEEFPALPATSRTSSPGTSSPGTSSPVRQTTTAQANTNAWQLIGNGGTSKKSDTSDTEEEKADQLHVVMAVSADHAAEGQTSDNEQPIVAIDLDLTTKVESENEADSSDHETRVAHDGHHGDNAAERLAATHRQWEQSGEFAKKAAEMQKPSIIPPAAPQTTQSSQNVKRFPAIKIPGLTESQGLTLLWKLTCNITLPGYFKTATHKENACSTLLHSLTSGCNLSRYIKRTSIAKSIVMGICAWPLMYRFMPHTQLGGWSHVVAPLGAGLIGTLGYFANKYIANRKYQGVKEYFMNSVARNATPDELGIAHGEAESSDNKRMLQLVQAIQRLQQDQ